MCLFVCLADETRAVQFPRALRLNGQDVLLPARAAPPRAASRATARAYRDTHWHCRHLYSNYCTVIVLFIALTHLE